MARARRRAPRRSNPDRRPHSRGTCGRRDSRGRQHHGRRPPRAPARAARRAAHRALPGGTARTHRRAHPLPARPRRPQSRRRLPHLGSRRRRSDTRRGSRVTPGASGEQRLADVPAVRASGRDGEDGRADRRGPLVEQVEFVESPLDRRELAVDVGLERDEDQAGVRDLGRRRGRRRSCSRAGRSARAGRRRALDACARTPGSRGSRSPSSRRSPVRRTRPRRSAARPLDWKRPDRLVATAAVEAVPRVEVHADAADHHARPAGQPPVARSTRRSSKSAVPGCRVGVPSTCPNRLRIVVPGRYGAVGAPEPLLCPAQRREAARVLQQHPCRVRDGERVVGGDLDQQVAVAELRLQPVDRERRQRPSHEGAVPPARGDESGAEAERDASAARARARAPARSRRARPCPGVRRAASSVRIRISRRSPSRSVSSQQVEGEEEAVRLRVGVDPGLVRAEEGHDHVAVEGDGAAVLSGERRCGGRSRCRSPRRRRHRRQRLRGGTAAGSMPRRPGARPQGRAISDPSLRARPSS